MIWVFFGIGYFSFCFRFDFFGIGIRYFSSCGAIKTKDGRVPYKLTRICVKDVPWSLYVFILRMQIHVSVSHLNVRSV